MFLKRFNSLRLSARVLAVIVLLGSYAAAGTSDWRFGIGTSLLPSPMAAGEDAAIQARKQFGEGEAKLVLLFPVIAQVTPEMVAGVAKHFPREIIYGGEVVAPLTPVTNLPDAKNLNPEAGVGVLVLGGDFELTIVHDQVRMVETAAKEGGDDGEEEDTFFNFHESGHRLGDMLAGAYHKAGPSGRLLVTFGDQYNGSNDLLASGIQDALGGPVALIGGATWSKTGKQIIAGEITTRKNFVALFRGDFFVTQALQGGMHTAEVAQKVIASTWEQGKGAEPFFAFIFNCRRRRTEMIARGLLGEELSVMQRSFKGVPFFGGYGPGEIGVRTPGTAAIGTGFSVSVALLFPNK